MDKDKVFLGHRLTVKQLWKGYSQPELVELSTQQLNKVRDCRKTLDMINQKEEPVYGVSTGFGHLENKWIPPEKQSQLQVNLIRSHAIGTGERVPRDVTKMAMVLLAHSLAKGHSGIRETTLNRIIYYIKEDIIPVSYTIGSLGASGDLAPLAHLALTIIGEGEVYTSEGTTPTTHILEERDLDPINLEAKEGLALINGTHFITAYAVLLLFRVQKLFRTSSLSAALTIEALRGTNTPFDEGIADLRGHYGHKVISSLMRQILQGSQIIEAHKDPRIDHKTQDAYAIRCIPQVMGGIWDAFGYLQRAIEVEINAVTDNPLIFTEKEEIMSGGNFHAEPLGFPLETCCMAMIELANITEARISRLVSPFTPELPAFLAKEPGIESGYMIAHYTVAALVNKLRGLGHPNIIDNIPVSGNQEDHVSMVMTTAVRAWTIVELVEEVVIFEMMMAIRGLNMVDHPPSSPILEDIMEFVNDRIDFTPNDHIIHDVLQEYKKLIPSEEFQFHISTKLDLPYLFT